PIADPGRPEDAWQRRARADRMRDRNVARLRENEALAGVAIRRRRVKARTRPGASETEESDPKRGGGRGGRCMGPCRGCHRERLRRAHARAPDWGLMRSSVSNPPVVLETVQKDRYRRATARDDRPRARSRRALRPTCTHSAR